MGLIFLFFFLSSWKGRRHWTGWLWGDFCKINYSRTLC